MPRGRRVPPSSGIPPRRRLPISSSRSTPRSRAARGAWCWSTAAATASIICSATCSSWRHRRFPAWRWRRSAARHGISVARGGDPPLQLVGPPGSFVTLLASRRPGPRDRHRGPEVPAGARRPRTGHDPRDQQRARARSRRPWASAKGRSSWCSRSEVCNERAPRGDRPRRDLRRCRRGLQQWQQQRQQGQDDHYEAPVEDRRAHDARQLRRVGAGARGVHPRDRLQGQGAEVG